MNTLRLTLRMLARDLRAGELTVLFVALMLAVAALTSVGFLADRVQRAVEREAHQLLGGDLLLTADHPWSDAFRDAARQRGLRVAESASLFSMVSSPAGVRLAEIKAVTEEFPLRGELRIAPRSGATERVSATVPSPGEVWLDPRLAAALDIDVGMTAGVGTLTPTVAAILTHEPDRGLNPFALAPRLMLNWADLPATGLVQPGSRVVWRLHVAGDAAAVDAFRQWASAHLGRGEKIEGLDDARPEVRDIIDRAQRFLRLAALLTVVLAAVAVGMTARRYMQRHLDACAVMRCLGASERQILLLHGGEFVVLGMGATLAGGVLGYLVQDMLHSLLAGLVAQDLPAAGSLPWWHGAAVGLVLVAGFVVPPLLRLKSVPAVRVLRREWGGVEPLSAASWLAGAGCLMALMVWIAGEPRLAGIVLGGFIAAVVLFALAGRVLLALAARLAPRFASAGWRFGFASLRRHTGATLVQVVALSLGLTTLLLLALARGDLLAAWQKKMPPDAPNRFLINIQPEQRPAVEAFFAQAGLSVPRIEPMVRGRLTHVNGQPVAQQDYVDERARRLVEREFNLSSRDDLPPGNEIVAGRWHGAGQGTRQQPIEKLAGPPQEFLPPRGGEVAARRLRGGAQGLAGPPQEFLPPRGGEVAAGRLQGDALMLSVEKGLADALRLRLGDDLTYEVAGQRFVGRIGSLRKLDWDSLRVNFFVITPAGALDGLPTSYITSFHLPAGREAAIDDLVRQFPNVTVIDVSALVGQLQAILDRAVGAVQLVFLFSLLAGGVVLYAAIEAGSGERSHELAVMRALGGQRRQLRQRVLAEFVAIGALAGLLSGLGATAIGTALARWVFRLDYLPGADYLFIGVAVGLVGVSLAGMMATRRAFSGRIVERLRGI